MTLANEIVTDLAAAARKTKRESGERKFLELWQRCGGPELERQVKLIDGRKFACDFVHRGSMTVIEIEGITFGGDGGGHQRGAAFMRDAEKHLLLALQGWRVWRLPTPMITEEWVSMMAKVLGGTT